MSRYVSINEVVASAMTILPGATDSEKVFMRHWAVLGNRELGLSKDNLITETINVQDLTMRKPENLLSIDDFGLYSADGKEYAHTFVGLGKRVHLDRDEIDGSTKYTIDVTEDGDFLHLSSNGSVVNRIKLRYYSIPIDDFGDPLILERKRLAISFFLSYMWAIRQGDNQAAIDRAEFRWLREAAKQRSKNKMPSVKEAQSIAKWYLSLISLPPTYRY